MARVDVRTDDGNWVVVSEGETLSGFERYRDAELRARQIAQSLGGGEVVVHARSGQIVEKQSVPDRGDSGRIRFHIPKIRAGRT